MGDGYNFRQLKDHILSLSNAATCEAAVKEWSLTGIYESDDPETCPCGHFPILEICAIHGELHLAPFHHRTRRPTGWFS